MVEIELAVGHELAGGHRLAVLDATLGAQPQRRLAVAAVDLRGIPPMRLGIGVGRRIFQPPAIFRLFALVVAGRVGPRTPDLHRAAALAPRIVRRERHFEFVAGDRLAVIEPVMRLELDPGRGQEVQGGRRDEVATRQQGGADQARARRQECRFRFGEGLVDRNVAAEAGARIAPGEVHGVGVAQRRVARAAHRGLGEVVVVAVEIALGQVERIERRRDRQARRVRHRDGRRIVEVAPAQYHAQRAEIEHRTPGRQAVPRHELVQPPKEERVDAPARGSLIERVDDDAVEHAGKGREQQRDACNTHIAVARQRDRGHQRREEDQRMQRAALHVVPEGRRLRAERDPPGQRHIGRPPQRCHSVAQRIGDAGRRLRVVEDAGDAPQDVIDAVPEVNHEGEPRGRPEQQPDRTGAGGATQHEGADRGNEQDDRDEDRVDRHVIVDVGRARALPGIADRRQVPG